MNSETLAGLGSEAIYICAHCDRADDQTRSWTQKCKLHAIKTTYDCVILMKGRVGRKVKFYDPDPKIVAMKQVVFDRIAEDKKNSRKLNRQSEAMGDA